MSKRGAHVIHSTGDKGTGDGKGDTLRKKRKINNEEGHFGKDGAQQWGSHVAPNPMGRLTESVVLHFSLIAHTDSKECVPGDDDWIGIVEGAIRVRPSGQVMRKGSLKKFMAYLKKARMGGLDLVFEGQLPMMKVLREEGLNSDEVDYLWKVALESIFLGAASSSRAQHAQLHTPSARDHLNFLLVQGAGDLVGATSGTVTGDLTFDQIIDRALKLKEMGKIKDFGL